LGVFGGVGVGGWGCVCVCGGGGFVLLCGWCLGLGFGECVVPGCFGLVCCEGFWFFCVWWGFCFVVCFGCVVLALSEARTGGCRCDRGACAAWSPDRCGCAADPRGRVRPASGSGPPPVHVPSAVPLVAARCAVVSVRYGRGVAAGCRPFCSKPLDPVGMWSPRYRGPDRAVVEPRGPGRHAHHRGSHRSPTLSSSSASGEGRCRSGSIKRSSRRVDIGHS